MQIEVKCYATLAAHNPDNPEAYPIQAGDTPGSVMQRLGVDPADVKIIFINGVHSKSDSPLKEGDRVGFFPAVGGG